MILVWVIIYFLDWILKAGKVSEISNGQMNHVDINGKEIEITNVDGKFYAFDERCGRMNARPSN